MFYTMNVAGLKRDLPLCRVNDDLYIGAFVIFGDVELTVACARELLKIAARSTTSLITAESKGIPLVYEMARQHGEQPLPDRPQGRQALHEATFSPPRCTSITTENRQMLCIDQDDADFMQRQARSDRGRRDLHRRIPASARRKAGASSAGGNVVGKMAILAEGAATGSPRHPLPRKTPALQPRRHHQAGLKPCTHFCAAEPCRGIEGHAGWPGFYRRSATGLAARRSGRAKALHTLLRGGAVQGHRGTCRLAGVLPPLGDRPRGSPVWQG